MIALRRGGVPQRAARRGRARGRQASAKRWQCGCRLATRLGAVATVALLSAGCEALPWRHDYLDRLDRVWIGAGDTQARNIRKLAVDPIPDPGPPIPPRYDGRRILAVMEAYHALEGNATEAASDGGTTQSAAATGGTP